MPWNHSENEGLDPKNDGFAIGISIYKGYSFR